MSTLSKPLVKQTKEAEHIRARFSDLLEKTNKDHPRPADIKALSDLLNGHKSLELWRGVASAGYMAELTLLRTPLLLQV